MAKLKGNAVGKEAKLPRGWGTWRAKLMGNAGGKAGSTTTSRLGNLDGNAEGQSCEQNYLEARKLGWQS